MTTRNELLTDLAEAIRELTEPRHHTEYLEATTITEIPTDGRRKKSKRTRRRRAHTVTLPSLLDALRDASIPGSSDTGAALAGFESRPSAELEPLVVLREITDDASTWCRVFDVERPTLARTLSALVSAPHDDQQLTRIAHQAERWVRRARLATGFDPAPVTLNHPCPYCHARHALTITGDLQNARCQRCGIDWTPDAIDAFADTAVGEDQAELFAMEEHR